MRVASCALLGAAALSLSAEARAIELVALVDDGSLLVLAADRPAETRAVALRGVGGRLVGIDWRPADRRLWGLSDRNDLYRIDVAAGTAELTSTLTLPFDGGASSGVDFTPQNDRLRLLGSTGQNMRVQVTLGATALDKPLAYASGDPNAGRRPAIAAAGYDHNVAAAPATTLFAIDADLDVLVRVDPPNDGQLATIGPLGIDVGPETGFEIVTASGGGETAFVAAGGALYTLDLASGRASPAGSIGGTGRPVIGLATLP
jgi:hypothetical protein